LSVVTLHEAGVALGGQLIWQDANVTIDPGTITAVLGPNGAGKSTLLNVIMGLAPLSSGSVSVLGHPAQKGNVHVGYMAQTRVADATATLRASDYVGLGFDGVRFGWRRDHHKSDAVMNALKLTGAQALAQRAMSSLSGGQRQRVALAHALVSSPALLLLDEPLAALDLAAQAEIVDLINLVRNETGTAVVVVAHDLNPLAPIVDQVLWIARRQVRSGSVEEVVNEATLSELYGQAIEILTTPSGRRVIVGLEEEFAHPHPHGHDHAHEASHTHFAEFYPEGPHA
jgi:zinc/manganese transport system ATP-binding protein